MKKKQIISEIDARFDYLIKNGIKPKYLILSHDVYLEFDYYMFGHNIKKSDAPNMFKKEDFSITILRVEGQNICLVTGDELI